MSVTLHTQVSNYTTWKAQILASYGDVKLDVVEHKNVKDFAKLSGYGISPVLETAQGPVAGSNTIGRFLAAIRPEAGLVGGSFIEKLQVEQWLDFSSNNVEPARAVWLYPVLKQMTYNVRTYNQAKQSVGKALRVLNSHLQNNTFLVGNSVTVADVTIATALVDLYTTVFTEKYLNNYKNVTRWFKTVINQPKILAILGEVKFAEKEQLAPKPVPKAKVAQQPKKKKQAPQVKQEKKKKAVDPRTLLPPTKMDLNAQKLMFFKQKPFGQNFFEQFWAQFDNEGFSVWTMDYNYDDENKEFWRTQNAIGMFLQRIGDVSKWGLGNIGIVQKDEETGPFHVKGLFMFRGPEVLAEIANGDGEWYTWNKIDCSTPAGQKVVEDYWLSDNFKDGMQWLDKRFYK